MNETIAGNSRKDESLLELMLALLASYSNDKFGHKLDAPSFPKMKYKGKTIQPQRIKAKRAPKIATMSESSVPEIPCPDFSLFTQHNSSSEFSLFDGRKGMAYRYEIELPLLMTGEKLLLEYNERGFHLRAGNLYEISLRWPESIDHPSSSFDTSTRKLLITFSPAKIQSKSTSKMKEDDKKVEEKAEKPIVTLTNPLLEDIV